MQSIHIPFLLFLSLSLSLARLHDLIYQNKITVIFMLIERRCEIESINRTTTPKKKKTSKINSTKAILHLLSRHTSARASKKDDTISITCQMCVHIHFTFLFSSLKGTLEQENGFVFKWTMYHLSTRSRSFFFCLPFLFASFVQD